MRCVQIQLPTTDPRTRRRAQPLIAAVCVALLLSTAPVLQASSPGTHYGAGNFPEGCSDDFSDGCYHMRVGLNRLDTPVIDVLLVTPASTYPERDLRVMRQSIEMWEAGIDYLAGEMALPWLADGVEFNIFLDDDEFTTHPAWDPEIIVVVSNPVGGAGIGIDPLGLKAPCKGANPLASFPAWEALPGFDSHHDGHSGTYMETCEGGGTTCYAVNGAIDPLPGFVEVFGVFNLVAHEVGHCLSIGHVGDGLDFDATNVPTYDIMAYDIPSHGKCVSTLDVEGFAVRMSHYLLDAPLETNAGNYHTQHPADHAYASFTGAPTDCAAPDVDLVPGPTVDFWPAVFHANLTGPASIPNGEAATFSVTAENANGTVTCTITAEGDPTRTNETGDGCAVDFAWATDGVYVVTATATDGDDEDDDALVVKVGDPIVLPAPDGSIVGGITIFPDFGVVAYRELLALAASSVDRVPKFLPGEAVVLHTRGTTDAEATVAQTGDNFTWHVWNPNATLVATAPCVTEADGVGAFDCIADYTMPQEPGRYYTTLRYHADGRWVCDDGDRLLIELVAQDLPPCLKPFDVLGASQTPTTPSDGRPEEYFG